MKQYRLSIYFIATLIVLQACTKTVYQTVQESEAPETDTTRTSLSGIQNDPVSTTSMPGNAATPATTNNDTGVGPGTPDTVQSSDDAAAVTSAAANTTVVNAIVANSVGLSDTSMNAPAVVGEPGDIVDCNLLLPCRWIGSNQDIMLTVGSVDNTGSLERLSLQYTVNTSHDTEMLLGNGSTALAPGGAEFNLVSQTLGAGNGLNLLNVLAGENVVGSATYHRAANSSTLAGWTLTIVDNGLPRTIGFINLPIGTPNIVATDCASVLPCQWESSRKDMVVTLVAVGGYAANGRLNVSFNVTTARAMSIVLDAGSTAIGAGAEIYDGRTHSLGIKSGFAQVIASTTSGASLPANVSFFRTPQAPTALKSLDLVMYEDAPTPRWNPQFLNLPTQ